VRLLGTLHLAVTPRCVGDILRAVHVARLLAGRGQRGLRQRGAVGAHIGDVAVLVESLRHAHRIAAVEPQLARGLLLQGGGDEGGRRAAGVGLLGDRGHLGVGSPKRRSDPRRHRFVEVDDLVRGQGPVIGEVTPRGDPATVDPGEFGGELLGGRPRRDIGLDVPVRSGAEGHPLPFALDHQPGGDGLHAARGQTRLDLAPQHRRDLVAIETVEDAPGLLRVDERSVEVARVVGGALDGLLGDLVEDHPLDRDLGLERLDEVPRDGLALAVLIRGQVELVGVLEGPLEFGDLLALVGIDDVVGLEVVLDVDAELPERPLLHVRRHLARGGDVADVADGGLHHPSGAQVSGDRLDLVGGLDDDELVARRGGGSHRNHHFLPRSRAADSSLLRRAGRPPL